MTPALQPAQAGARFSYERHRPEETALYRVVQEELETFFAQVYAHTESSVPEFVENEFEWVGSRDSAQCASPSSRR